MARKAGYVSHPSHEGILGLPVDPARESLGGSPAVLAEGSEELSPGVATFWTIWSTGRGRRFAAGESRVVGGS
jgi:hypothetical protein